MTTTSTARTAESAARNFDRPAGDFHTMNNQNAVKKQIKFAVVMYGGGSLAIYINGVAQELLKLAQATTEPNNGFDGTTLIYRKVALLLSDDREAFDEVGKLQEEIADLNKKAKMPSAKAEF